MKEEDKNNIGELSNVGQMVESKEEGDLKDLDEHEQKEIIWTRNSAKLITHKLRKFIQGRKKPDDLLRFIVELQKEFVSMQDVLRIQKVRSMNTEERIEFIESDS